MANCAPCLRLGLQVVAHYDADLTSGKEAECYYHHFGMPLPKSIQEKIAQPNPAQTKVDNREDEECDAPEPQRKKDRPWSGAINGRAGLDPDVCAECWKNGHVCKPHCTVDGERLCIDCADGKPCAIAREKEKNPRTPAHERYRVTIPGGKKTPKPRAADVALVTDEGGRIVGVTRTKPAAVASPSTKPGNISLVLDDKGVPARAVHTSKRVEAPTVTAVPQTVQVPTAGKDLQEEKERTNMPPRLCQCKPGCTEIAKSNASPYARGHNPNLKKKVARPAARKSKASPPRNSVSRSAPKPNGVATLCVSEEHLNNFLLKLSLEQKTNIVQRQLEGA
jgi:hypothetical protein